MYFVYTNDSVCVIWDLLSGHKTTSIPFGRESNKKQRGICLPSLDKKMFFENFAKFCHCSYFSATPSHVTQTCPHFDDHTIILSIPKMEIWFTPFIFVIYVSCYQWNRGFPSRLTTYYFILVDQRVCSQEKSPPQKLCNELTTFVRLIKIQISTSTPVLQMIYFIKIRIINCASVKL